MPEFQFVREFLAYVNLGPQLRDAPPRSHQVRSRSGERRTIQLYGEERDPWGPTAPASEAAYRAGRMLLKVLELPRDKPLLDMAASALKPKADRTDLEVFQGAWVVLHALAAAVTRAASETDGSACLRTREFEILYEDPGARDAWKAAHEALESLLDDAMVAWRRHEPRVVGPASAPAAVGAHEAVTAGTPSTGRTGKRRRVGRPLQPDSQAVRVRDLLLELKRTVSAKGIQFELKQRGVAIKNPRYAADRAVDRFPQEIGKAEFAGDVLYGMLEIIKLLPR